MSKLINDINRELKSSSNTTPFLGSIVPARLRRVDQYFIPQNTIDSSGILSSYTVINRVDPYKY